MNGPEHQSQAEILLAEWWKNRNDMSRGQQFMPWLAAAQVHATLAVAATLERTQTGSAHPEAATPQRLPEAARTSHGASGHREHRVFSFFRRPPE